MTQPISGDLKVSNDCLADLAGYAAMECYGVVGMALVDKHEGVSRLLPSNRLRRGVEIHHEGSTLVVELHVFLEKGVNMRSVSDNLTQSVRFLLNKIAQIESVDVRVHVVGMRNHS